MKVSKLNASCTFINLVNEPSFCNKDTNDECKFEMNEKDTSLKYGEAYLDSDMANKIREWDKVIDLVSKDEVSFDPRGDFITDVEVEFPEASKLILITL
ncbi:hypothetical protein Tco_1484024 [Tanacetum coccineum]